MAIIYELGLIFIAATTIGLLGRYIRLPLIVSYILAGLLIGPFGLKLIVDPAQIKDLSTLGVVFLLFLVGIDLNFKKLKEISKISFFTVIGQMALIILAVALITKLLGYSTTTGILIGIAFLFNSTIIVIRNLGERHALDSLHGRIAVGILLMQDAIAIITLILINSFSGNMADLTFSLIRVALGGIIIISGSILFGSYIFPTLFRQFAKSTELLMISAIGWALFSALIAQKLGFSLETGAFIAGISIASLPYTIEISAKVQAIRDFFIVIFFVALGMTVNFHTHFNYLQLIYLLLVIIVFTPFVITILLLIQGYKPRTSLLTAISFSQIGEFSLIVVSLLHNAGKIDTSLISTLTLLTIVSIIISSFMMNNSHIIINILSPLFKNMGLSGNHISIKINSKSKDHVVVFGAHHIGQSIIQALKSHPKLKEDITVVDINPTIIENLKSENINLIYGDIHDQEILEACQIDKAQLVISTIPDYKANLAIAEKISKNHRRKTYLFLTARNPHEAISLYENGADYIILPQFLSGEYVASIIEKFEYEEKKNTRRDKHIKDLKSYIEEGIAIA
jgi:Kef-type K+ transport system membrane component KefB